MTYTADPRTIRVITNSGSFLFSYNSATRTIEFMERGERYSVPLWMIEEFSRTSQRSRMTVYPEPKEEKLPCGHVEGTVLDEQFNTICSVCGR